MEYPLEVEHIWSWFCELSSTRSANGFGGINPIDHKEIAAWAALMRNDPSPWEVRTLRRMDDAVRVIMADKKSPETVKGSVQDTSDADAMKTMFRAMGAKAG